MNLYNTLTGKIEGFKPIDHSNVEMFVCGPTVYDYSHLGHAKTYIQFDIAARALKYIGYGLTYLQNITDIDDRIIDRANEKGVSYKELASEFEKYYLEDMAKLNVTSVDKYARATDYIQEIISQVKRLIEKGYAYKISDGYYFDISKFSDYGKLSGRKDVRPEDAIARVDENPEKKNPGDFALWKFKKENEPSWGAEFGEGRPGWHIEDTAITEAVFGPQYDLHGGARDLIFPHHEAEIAQMESLSGLKPLVRYWMHTGFLNINAEKMSKSKGNFTTIRDAVAKGVSPLALRYYFLSVHYRSPMNFTWEGLEAAQNAYKKLKETFSRFDGGGAVNEGYKKEFMSALEEDLNMPAALAVVWNLVKDEKVPETDKRATLLDFDLVLGLDIDINEYALQDIPEDVQTLLDDRAKARAEKDFDKSDELRDRIREKGFKVKDTSEGQELSKI